MYTALKPPNWLLRHSKSRYQRNLCLKTNIMILGNVRVAVLYFWIIQLNIAVVADRLLIGVKIDERNKIL